MAQRIFPHVRVRHISPNQSTRSGVPLNLIVLHDTESTNVSGLADLIGLGNWFGATSSRVSSHVATDAEGNSARYVADRAKAWHCMSYNSASLGIEQIGHVTQTFWPQHQLAETARWIAYWSRLHGIPIQLATVSNGTVVKAGVCRHSDLGVAGGNHDDPGAGYPLAKVLAGARAYRALQNAAT